MGETAYLVVSDLHITDVELHDDDWMRHKAPDLVYDAHFARLLAHFTREGEAEGKELHLILNGDILDFDLVTATPAEAPFSIARRERKYGLDPTEPKARWKLALILEHHPELVAALARFAAAGHTIVYVIGNHDRELYFEGVQADFARALAESAAAQGLELEAEQAVRFEDWFFYREGEIYAEHGHQYDPWSSFAYVLAPTTREGRTEGEEAIVLPMGNYSARYLTNRMGYFNPHAGDFLRTGFSYFSHWVRRYAFTRRSLFFSWFWGSLLVFLRLVDLRRRVRAGGPERHRERRAALADRNRLPEGALEILDRLKRRPITARLPRILRELWFDRVVMAMFMTGGTVALALTPIPLWIKLMVPLACFPLIYLIYEGFFTEDIYAFEREIPDRAREIGRLVHVPVVTFGHTHRPAVVPLARDMTFVNTGTWAPTLVDKRAGTLDPGKWNYLWLELSCGKACVRLESWLPYGAKTTTVAAVSPSHSKAIPSRG